MSYEPQYDKPVIGASNQVRYAHIIGYELLRVLLPPPPRGNFVDYVFHKGYHLTSFLKHVSLLAAGAFGCYSVLIT